MSLTAVSQVLGFVRDAVIAAVYGAGASLDAYLVAQGVMNLVLALVAGAMARALVPPVSRAAEAGDPDRAHRTVQTVLTVTAIVLLAASGLLLIRTDVVVAVLAPGFDAPTAELAAQLTHIVLIATLFVAGTNVLAAAAQAHGRFFWSGIEGVPFNLMMIAAAAWAGPRFGIEALAVGFVVGSAARFVSQLPAARAVGLRLRPRFDLRQPDVQEVLRLTPPLLVTSAAANVNTLVDRAVGSSQGQGVITSLSLGWRVVTVVDSLLVVTVVAALYPAFSAAGIPERRAELRGLVERSLRVLLLLLAPVTAVLVVGARPIVQLVFGRGDFDAAAVNMTATAVTFYAVSAVAVAVRSTASRACLAVGDRRTPILVALMTMALNVLGDLTLGIAYGIPGLAVSTSLSLVAGAALSVALLSRRHGAVSLRPLALSTMRTGAAALLAGAAAAGLAGAVVPAGNGAVAALAQLTVIAATVGVLYVGLLVVFRNSELADVRRLLNNHRDRS